MYVCIYNYVVVDVDMHIHVHLDVCWFLQPHQPRPVRPVVLPAHGFLSQERLAERKPKNEVRSERSEPSRAQRSKSLAELLAEEERLELWHQEKGVAKCSVLGWELIFCGAHLFVLGDWFLCSCGVRWYLRR